MRQVFENCERGRGSENCLRKRYVDDTRSLPGNCFTGLDSCVYFSYLLLYVFVLFMSAIVIILQTRRGSADIYCAWDHICLISEFDTFLWMPTFAMLSTLEP